ncbi:hypothetical protein LINGRAHAP2_LOCUS24353 [Linum grandiflorum]
MVHSRSASDHDVDGAVETGNEHLRHVPRRVHSYSIGCYEPDGLTGDRRCVVCGIREEDELGCFG